MQRTMQKSEELYIENPRLDHKLCQDLINYDIIYIQASLEAGENIHFYLIFLNIIRNISYRCWIFII